MPHTCEKVDNSTALVNVGRELASGRLNTVNELRELCHMLEDEGIANMILDFSNVKLCPSVVLGNIIVLAKRLKEKNGKVIIASPSPHVEKAARIVGITKTIKILQTLDEALKEIKGPGGIA
ncbi:MAG: STAS domain-containing protein [Deltaproteobacteria bacterium]|nr:STAS domain-containing protein [Deltaproteobacteria bacterium]MBW1928321.1 STAS domain-containing protein [Deltaproteobacteria bacterium]MBW2026856.1 STAS domain-containing protein [Deltaproteobacteria bacterium]MBW2126836.1 STAS domain-containing protein [Deltaproteobacteria bacterium]RLB24254.1 MAG: hypothetical protein DRG76_01975 [Deltaproteobacteria bacterium]